MENRINFLVLFLGLFFYSTNIQAQLYSEKFTGQNGKGIVGGTPPVTDVSGVDWSIASSNTTGLTAATDWFQVQNEVMEARDVDEEVVWESPSITVTGLTSTVNLSIDFSEEGNLESGDYARAYYVLDGGAEVLFSTNGDNSDDFTATTAEQSLTFSGNTSLKIVIRIDNNSASELIHFDNVSVTVLAPCTTPASQATALVLSPNTSKITGSFTEANSSLDNYLVIKSTSSTLSSNPVNATTYNIGDAIGGGTVVTKTSLTSFSANDLTQGTQYYFYVFAYNSLCTGGPNYNVTTPLTGNISTATTPDIIITEIMLNPDAVSDANGEYFEIYNNTASTVDINGWAIKDAGGVSHTINNGGALDIVSGGYLVLGRNSDSGTNGGVTVNYAYSGFSLTNSEDEIILESSSGNEVDRVEYDNSFPNVAGASMYLTQIPSDNNVPSSWASSTTSIGIDTDKGSPGNIGEATLPVALSDFYGKKLNNTVQLFWETATELNNSHFEIERSADGKNFNTIGEVIGNGTTLEVQKYSFTDKTPFNGVNYYRLKQVDFDGQFEYSKIISITKKVLAQDIRIAPNPAKTKFNITFPSTMEQKIRMEIFNMNGQQVRSQILNVAGGLQTINISNLQTGMYIINLTTNSGVITKRIVKQ